MRPLVSSSIALLAVLAAAAPAAGQPQEIDDPWLERAWLPDACLLTLEVERALLDGGEDPGESDEARWNRFYRLGIDAVGGRDLERAGTLFCRALEVAGSFGPRDIRFAETLDELGLVAFLREDYAESEAMQGAAVAEMLLALGPPSEDLCEAAKKSCASSVATYMTRLGWIFERQGRPREIDPLMREPYRILGRGYVPFDAADHRLEWLIARYLLAEDFAAADWLSSLRDEPD